MEQSQTRSKVIQTASIMAVLVLFYIALTVLRREIRISHNGGADVLLYFKNIPLSLFFKAFLMCMGSYFAITFYDVLGLKHIRKSLSYGRTALTSFIAYTFSHNIGMAPITGGGIRYRLYSSWGLTAGESASVLLICGMTFWVGFLTMGAVFFFLQPPDLPPFELPPAHFLFLHFQFDSTVFSGMIFWIGTFCALVLTTYLLSALFLRRTIKIARWQFPTPSLPVALGQMAAGCLDWTCSGTALYLLLPSSSLTFPSFMTIYLSAQIIGFISQVPGGLGVLEMVILATLKSTIPATSLGGALLAFRLCYYLIPFAMGLLSFAVYEIIRNKAGFKRALQILNRWAPDFAPHVFSILIFISGGLLLFSNVSPEVNRRMVWLNEFMPLSLLESSHFLTGLVGAGLLVLARGLQKRLESAFILSLVLLGVGVLGCLFKGFDYQEALTLLVVFGALLPSRRYFPRKASVFQQGYPPVWVTAILFVWLGSIWIGVFNYRYEDYTSDLWTTFDLVEDAARFLRATLGVTLALLVFSIVSLLSPAQPETEVPKTAELEKALGVLKNARRAYASLALLRDKALFFNRKSDAFLMYAIEGKSWVTLGDPVGVEKEQQELALKFKDLCRRNKALTVFYQVDQDHFQFYLDMGLTVLKIAEEARVSLKSFKLETLASADLKNTYQRFKEKEDYQFEVLPPEGIQPHIASMREVSEAWLSKNKTREKGFSVGFFNEEYLRRFPLAIVRKEGKIAAFTNLLQGSAKEEVGVDLLRSSAEAPEFLVDYLLLEVMLWAKEKGHKWFTLGSAPLLDVAESPLAPFKDQIAETLSPYTPGAKLPDIRKEKERFNPEWSPKYIASSGNLSLQVAFNNIRSLISKGNRVEFKK